MLIWEMQAALGGKVPVQKDPGLQSKITIASSLHLLWSLRLPSLGLDLTLPNRIWYTGPTWHWRRE